MSVTTLKPRSSAEPHVQTPSAPAASGLRKHAPPRLRPGPHTPLRHIAAGLRLTGHWPEILSDLGVVGRVHLELATPQVRFVDALSLEGLRVDGGLATLAGAEQSLRLLLDRCHALSVAPGRDALLLEDDLGRPLLRLRPAETGAAWPWRLVLGGILGGAERVVPLRSSAPANGLGSLTSHPLGTLQAQCDDEAEAPDLYDTAELSGQLVLEPTRLRRDAADRGGAAVAVDPTLVPCVLRSLCEELLPVIVTAGSDALVARRRATFHAYDWAQGRAQLMGAETHLAIDTAAIDSAWVVGSGAPGGGGRQLRLYDGDGRALALIAAAPAACDGGAAGPDCCGCREPRFWRCLMNALTS